MSNVQPINPSRPVFVMGTMRSGTSMVCHVLTHLADFDFIGTGPSLPFDNYNKKEHNPNGYYERRDVHQAYADLYQSYDKRKTRTMPLDLIHTIHVPDKDTDKPVVTFLTAMRGILANVRTHAAHGCWGLKGIQMAQDLRLLKTLEPNAVIVYCFRARDAVQIHAKQGRHRKELSCA
jgi:hypothetical protein